MALVRVLLSLCAIVQVTSGLTCYNGTSLENRFSKFVVTGCKACTKSVANYRLHSTTFSYYSWSGIGCVEPTVNWTSSLATEGDPPECGIGTAMVNEGFRGAILNETYNCSALEIVSGSSRRARSTWKNTCICCSNRCNSASMWCNKNSTVSDFGVPEMFLKNETGVNMHRLRDRGSSSPHVGLTCFVGSSLDSDGSSELKNFARNCSACTKHVVTYSFMGYESTYSIWGGIGCGSPSPLSQKPDFNSKCFIDSFGKRLSINLQEIDIMDAMSFEMKFGSGSHISKCIPSVTYGRSKDSGKASLSKVTQIGCTCCQDKCNRRYWSCGEDGSLLYNDE